jgi:surface protein
MDAVRLRACGFRVQMFFGASAFNSNIGGWNTALVSDMYDMFDMAAAFNQNIGKWNTASVSTMSSVMLLATAFATAGLHCPDRAVVSASMLCSIVATLAARCKLQPVPPPVWRAFGALGAALRRSHLVPCAIGALRHQCSRPKPHPAHAANPSHGTLWQ